MKKILHVISSPRGEASLSIKLGNAIVEKIKEAYPGSTITESNLVSKQFPHLEEAHLTSFFTPAEQHTPENAAAIKHSYDAIQEISDADILVIGAPVYNFSIHSTLKAWIDHIVRAGVTFRYSENGPVGLIKDKKVYVAISSGGVYSSGDMKQLDFVEPYLKYMFGFIGLTDVTFFRVEGTAYPNLKDTALQTGIDSIVL